MKKVRIKRLNKRNFHKSPQSEIRDRIDDITLQRFTARIQRENNERKMNGIPIAKYDLKLGAAYLEYTDGHREYLK